MSEEHLKTIQIRNTTDDYNSYRAARVKSLFNVESGSNFSFDVQVDLSGEWQIGVIVGPSGSGKTSLGRKILDDTQITDLYRGWDNSKPIIDEIGKGADFDDVTAALASIGLGDVPAWLRSFGALSNGQQFRAGLARIMVDKPDRVIIDEFTSVIDRQIAKVGAAALQKAWRRDGSGKKIVLISPHYDILDWIQPDWVVDTKDYTFTRRSPSRRPEIDLQIWKTNSSYWRQFEPHHYLKLPLPIAASYFVGTVNGELAFHCAATPLLPANAVRLVRIVTMPEWQGIGVGMQAINWVAEYHLQGNGIQSRKLQSILNTSHAGLIKGLRKSPFWVQKNAKLYAKAQKVKSSSAILGTFGGHLRAIQGFKYIGGDKSPKIELL